MNRPPFQYLFFATLLMMAALVLHLNEDKPVSVEKENLEVPQELIDCRSARLDAEQELVNERLKTQTLREEYDEAALELQVFDSSLVTLFSSFTRLKDAQRYLKKLNKGSDYLIYLIVLYEEYELDVYPNQITSGGRKLENPTIKAIDYKDVQIQGIGITYPH
jgi:hypothetical protein